MADIAPTLGLSPSDCRPVAGISSRVPKTGGQLMLIAQRPSLTEEIVEDCRSRFVIEPLEPGFGY
ncbi:hypothetical protein AB0C11_43880, partial [Streptomyces sp. NPDC039016]|uniref:hypothetical protein n=1 Tax=Streptomyces sp. NPDC039016 TaxID=3154330 RepID=UPI0033EB5E3E